MVDHETGGTEFRKVTIAFGGEKSQKFIKINCN